MNRTLLEDFKEIYHSLKCDWTNICDICENKSICDKVLDVIRKIEVCK